VSVVADDGKRVDEAATGDGPIDATFRALVRATGHVGVHLEDFQVRSVTWGEDAQGRVTVVCRRDDETTRGSGLSTDIVEASARAVIDVINQWERAAATTPVVSSTENASEACPQ
jgi:2-isopropylmalate synthase